jgi:ATP-dependent DNA ligase
MLDGELVVEDESGVSDFSVLQADLREVSTSTPRAASHDGHVLRLQA